jgi:hypothetical protein
MAPRAQAVDDDLAGGLVGALHPARIGLGERLGGVIEAGLRGAPVQIGRFGLLWSELLHQGLANLFHFDRKQVRHHAVVNHVAHQLAQLGLGADRPHQFVERYRVKMQVGADLAELERFVVDHPGTGFELAHVLLRRFRIHGHQKIDLLAAADVAVPGSSYGEPGGQTGDVRREHVLAGNRNPHLKDGAHQNGIRGLAAGTVDCCDLKAEIVD